MPRIVTRPVIDSIASVTRPSWRNVVALRHWLRHAKTVIMSGMGGGSLCRILGWGIHSLHVDQPPCLISVLAKVLPYETQFIINSYKIISSIITGSFLSMKEISARIGKPRPEILEAHANGIGDEIDGRPKQGPLLFRETIEPGLQAG